LLAHRAVLITLSKLEGDQLQVNICPRQLKEGENSALTIPLCLTGTAAELDSELVSQVSSFVATHVGLNTNLAAVEKEIAEAEKAAREEARKKQKVVGNGGKKATEPASAPPPSTSKPEAESAKPLSLFDESAPAATTEPAQAPQTA
jgi:PRTRC genetic system protein E